MQFKIITPEVLGSCLSSLLRNNYKKSYKDFSKFVNLEISEDDFNEFKTRDIKVSEIKKIILNTGIDEEKEVRRIESIWNEKEDEILSTMKELCGFDLNLQEIACFVDPYQKGGYYGEESITVGTYKNPEDVLFVIAHELFHIFYWKKLTELKITKSTMGNESPKEWELAETTVHLITTEEKMIEHWKNIDLEIYPELEDLYKELKILWEDNSFEVYLKKSYEFIEYEK